MEYYFNIAQIGIRINGFRAMKIIESNLIPFITSLEIYESLQEKVTILVKEVSNFEIEEMVHADTENNRNYASFGHSKYEQDGGEYDEDANFNPYYANRIIALDGCTAKSKIVNCIVIED